MIREDDAARSPGPGAVATATSKILLIGALLALAFIVPGFRASADSIAAPSQRPSLHVLQLDPVRVRGQSFKAGERVHVVLLSADTWTRRVRASEAGSFTATFRAAVVDRCRGFNVRASGALGSRAVKGGLGQGSAEAEKVWLERLRILGLEPERKVVLVAIKGSELELTVRLTLPADAARVMVFPDALYGAMAYAFESKRWQRADTAEVRAQSAPVLEPGESATVRLPVKRADSYRVLVPVEGKAAWGCSVGLR